MSEADDVRRFGDVRTETRYERTVQIEASGVARYRVGVTGLLTAEDGPQSALADGVAREVIADETRTLRFTGEFTEFSIRGDATVRVDGEPFDVEAFPHNTLEIDPNGTVTYDVSASGAVSLDEGAADQPNARTATARTSSTHVLSYAGELTHIEVDGDATIRRNGSRVGRRRRRRSAVDDATRVHRGRSLVSGTVLDRRDGIRRDAKRGVDRDR
jgi:hypothetical protein